MNEQLKIFTEQLRDGRKEKIDVVLSPDFLDLSEEEIQTPSEVRVQGEAYCLDDLLMLSLDVATEIEMSCSICNTDTRILLQNKNILLSMPLSELPSTIFDYTDLLREEIIMLIPQFVECTQGSCPQRKELQPYLKTNNKDHSHNFPFADL